jgi:signal peptidase I
LELLFEAVQKDGHAQLVARGHSMAPTIKDGDVVILEKRPASIGTGDVVAFDSGQGELVIHRVVGMDAQDQLLTKGDGATRPDGWIHQARVGAVARALKRGEEQRPMPIPEKPHPRQDPEWGLRVYRRVVNVISRSLPWMAKLFR